MQPADSPLLGFLEIENPCFFKLVDQAAIFSTPGHIGQRLDDFTTSSQLREESGQLIF
jgi:hypothetical protein